MIDDQTVERFWVYRNELLDERPHDDEEDLYVEVIETPALGPQLTAAEAKVVLQAAWGEDHDPELWDAVEAKLSLIAGGDLRTVAGLPILPHSGNQTKGG